MARCSTNLISLAMALDQRCKCSNTGGFHCLNCLIDGACGAGSVEQTQGTGCGRRHTKGLLNCESWLRGKCPLADPGEIAKDLWAMCHCVAVCVYARVCLHMGVCTMMCQFFLANMKVCEPNASCQMLRGAEPEALTGKRETSRSLTVGIRTYVGGGGSCTCLLHVSFSVIGC
jgi:hypothetical protein